MRPLSDRSEDLRREEGDLIACKAGDPQAIEALFHRYGDLVQRMIGRLIGPSADLEDLVQTTFLEALRNLGRFRGEASFKTWLTGIAIHVAQHHLRAGRVRRHVPLELVPESLLPTESAQNDQELDGRKLALKLHTLLDSIAPKKRIALLLHVLDDRPVEEIAALMRASQTATRSRMFFARRELRKLIAADGALSEMVDHLLQRSAAEGER